MSCLRISAACLTRLVVVICRPPGKLKPDLLAAWALCRRWASLSESAHRTKKKRTRMKKREYVLGMQQKLRVVHDAALNAAAA